MNKNQESKAALKSTGIVGGGQIINILIGLIRTKVVAIILGPTGVGIVGLLTTASDMVRNITTIGIPFSGVRDISIASASETDKEVSKVVSFFLKWMFYLSLLGSFTMIVLCVPLSNFMFGSDSYSSWIGILSISVFFTSLSSGYASVMQGRRAITLMVKSGIVSNLISAILTIILYIFLKKDAIVTALVTSAIVNFTVLYFYYKKLQIPKFSPRVTLTNTWPEAKTMISIGFFTIVVSVFDQIMSLGLRSFISDKAGVEGVGLFTAATTIATTYLAIVLNSLGSDYYPRLAAINKDDNALNVAVNTQLQIVLLLAVPFIVGMICFGDLVIKILYSKDFIMANEVLKWQILGDFFKIISWPCGYVFLAKGFGKLYVGFSITYTLVYVAIIYFGWGSLGFFGIGISFFISQFLGLLFTYTYSYIKFKIKISADNQKIIFFTSFILVIAYLVNTFLLDTLRIVFSISVFVIMLGYSLKKLSPIMDIKEKIDKIKSQFKK